MRLRLWTVVLCGMCMPLWSSLACTAQLRAERSAQGGEPTDPVQQWIDGHSTGMSVEHRNNDGPSNEILPWPCAGGAVGSKPEVRTLQLQDSSAVVVVSGINGEEPCEQYCFVQRTDTSWRIVAVQAMPYLTELRSARDVLHRMEQRTPEQEAELARYRLLTGADAGLRAYVMQHQSTLQRIVDLYQAGKRSQALKLARSISIIEIDEAEDDGSARVEFILGGMHDTAVGVLFAPRPEDLPRMTAAGFIYVEQVTPMFFVFRSL